MTYYWQETARYPHWRVQTDSAEVAEKLRRRAKGKQIGYGHNKDGNIWLLRIEFSRKDNAERSLDKIDPEGSSRV